MKIEKTWQEVVAFTSGETYLNAIYAINIM